LNAVCCAVTIAFFVWIAVILFWSRATSPSMIDLVSRPLINPDADRTEEFVEEIDVGMSDEVVAIERPSGEQKRHASISSADQRQPQNDSIRLPTARGSASWKARENTAIAPRLQSVPEAPARRRMASVGSKTKTRKRQTASAFEFLLFVDLSRAED
jgi:hypothetical protein